MNIQRVRFLKWITGLTLGLALTVPAFAQKPQGAAISDSDASPQAKAEALLGFARLKKGDREGAIPHLRSAVRLEPKWAPPHYGLGAALEQTGNVLEAAGEYCRAAQLDPKDIDSQADCNRMIAESKNLPGRLRQVPGSSDPTQDTPSWPPAVQGPVGARYGTRDPTPCPSSRKEPVNGPISVKQATLYFTCSREKEDEGLYLIENLTLQVGKGRPPTAIEIAYLDDLDHDSLVYPIRGSFRDYHCYTQRSSPGRNCSTWDEPEAEGKCYRTSFGDWTCSMVDNQHLLYNQRENVPPPPLR